MPSQPSGLKASKLAGEKSPPGAADHIPWSIHSTPFWNPSQVKPDHSSIELAAMFHLVQDKRVYLEPLSAGQSTAELVASIPVIPRDPRIGASLIDRLERLQAHAPVFNLHFLPDASFWRVIDELSLN
jgi:hypothetical protein